MSAVTNLCGLPLGQTDEPTPDLVAAVASALADPDLVALANQVAEQSVELIGLAGARQIIEHAAMTSQQTGQPAAEILQSALANMAVGIENAKAELARSDSRLAAFLRSLQ